MRKLLDVRIFAIHCSSSLSCMNEYLAIDSGAYMCTNILYASVFAWLVASKRSQDNIQLKKSACEQSVRHMSSKDGTKFYSYSKV